MMKYLKAEAEIIKFDNSDVVTASEGYEDVGNGCSFSPGFQCPFIFGNLCYAVNGTNWTWCFKSGRYQGHTKTAGQNELDLYMDSGADF